jgi:hypothetical protein
MTDFIEEEDVQPSPFQHWQKIARAMVLFVPPAISLGCAITVGYLTYMVANKPAPADMSTLAVSILKSGDVSPEMRDWATSALGIQTDIPMTK